MADGSQPRSTERPLGLPFGGAKPSLASAETRDNRSTYSMTRTAQTGTRFAERHPLTVLGAKPNRSAKYRCDQRIPDSFAQKTSQEVFIFRIYSTTKRLQALIPTC